MPELLSYFLAGIAAGAVNAAAGGAKLFVFPILLAFGMPPLVANATGTVSLWPAQLPAIWVYRRELRPDRHMLLHNVLPCLLGGLLGALTLVYIGEKTFLVLVPFFILAAVFAIAMGRRLADLLQSLVGQRRLGRLALSLQGLVGFYGGFFGAGIGFMLIAVLALTPDAGLQRANALKNLLVFLIYTGTVVPLSLSGLVDWHAVPFLLGGGMLGGYLGAGIVRGLPETPLRIIIAGMGLVLSAVYLARHVF